jgi:hypothetical protein
LKGCSYVSSANGPDKPGLGTPPGRTLKEGVWEEGSVKGIGEARESWTPLGRVASGDLIMGRGD